MFFCEGCSDDRLFLFALALYRGQSTTVYEVECPVLGWTVSASA